MYKCSFPECNHVAAYAILNSHAKTHGYERVSAMTKVHGPIEHIKQNPYGKNQAERATVNISDYTFNNIESAMARLRKKDRTTLTNRS